MKRLFLPVRPAMTSRQSRTMGDRLYGSWLSVARVTWVAVAALSLVYYVTSIPIAFAQLQTVCTTANCTLTPSSVQELRAMGLSVGFFAAYSLAIALIFVVVSCAVGVVIFWRKADDRMALFAALALVTFGEVPFSGLLAHPAAGSPLWRVSLVVVTFLGETSPVIFFFLFPDGRFVPRWTRLLAVLLIVLELCGIFFPASLLFRVLLPYRLEVFAVFLASALFALFYRYWRVSGPVQRQQTKWVVFGITVAVVVSRGVRFLFLLLSFHSVVLTLIGNTIFYLSLLLIPLSIGIAILRYRLWDIDVIINRTLVYAILSASIAGIYVLIVGSLGTLLQAQGNLLISLLATGVIAVLFQPLRERLQHAVNRLIYGERDDPYRVLARLGQRLGATLAPEAVFPTIVETVAQALKLPYAALTLKQHEAFRIAAVYGSSVETPLHLPLAYQSEIIGELLLAPRAHGDTFTAADHRLLNDLARQVEVAVHAVRLTVDLQRSRERLVTAREEERRRLRRDLHDGLGPSLAGLSLKVGAIRNLLPPDQSPADRLLVELSADIEEAVGDIRRIVYNLRPPSLDELGLIGAIRARAAQYSVSSQHGALHVRVEATDRLPPLPAATEVAAYRIMQEALTNVTRHAQARTCCIVLSVSDGLYLEITDDGVGLPAEDHIGVGRLAMQERASELGGTCLIEAIPAKGTRVLAYLPLPKE